MRLRTRTPTTLMFQKLLSITVATTLTASAVTLTIDSLPRYAIRHNPQLDAARLRIDEARGRLLASGRLANPELEVEGSHNVRMPERTLGLGWMQKFPLTARLRLEKAVSQAQLAAALAEVRDAERRLATETRTAAVKLLALSGRRGLVEQQISNTRAQKDFLSKRLAAGEASAVDLVQLELEGEELGVELLQLESTRANVIGELRPLLGIQPDELLAITGSLPAPGPLPAWRRQ